MQSSHAGPRDWGFVKTMDLQQVTHLTQPEIAGAGKYYATSNDG